MRVWNPEAVRLALISRDETCEPLARMSAMVQLDSMMKNGTLIVDTDIPTLARSLVDDRLPKYIWKNGARIKVKQ